MIIELICKRCDGVSSYETRGGKHKVFCEDCRREICRTRSQEYRRRILIENPLLYKQRMKISNAKEKQKHLVIGDWRLLERRRTLKSRHSITLEEYNWLLIKQNNRCALCGQEDMTSSPRSGRLHVDHDHSHKHDGKHRKSCKQCIRGLICDGCNYRCLPWAEKDIELQGPRVREYLRRRPFQFD